MNIKKYLRGFWIQASRVAERTGKGVLAQAFEIVASRWRNPTLGTFDYYIFRLHDAYAAKSEKAREYLGWRVQEQLAQALNPRSAVMPAWDKFTFHLHASAFGLPVPRILVSFRPNMTIEWHVPGELIRSARDLANWLRSTDTWPMFAKPSYSQQSKGCYYLERYSASDDAIVISGGEQISVERFVNDVVLASNVQFFRRDMGYLFQEVLCPHESIAKLAGNRTISAIRVVIVQDEDGAEVIAAVWKIARGSNISDTRVDDELGHLHAPIDIATGIAGPALKGYELQPYELNPDTGSPINGFQMPYWHESIEVCLRAASMFPMMRIQHWDLAITDCGPCLLEVNDVGVIEFLQMFGNGLLAGRLREVLRRHGDSRRFAWIKQLCG